MRKIYLIAVCAALLIGGGPARAAEFLYGVLAPPPPPPQPAFLTLTELRIGGFVHDPTSPERGSVDLNAEFLLGKVAHVDSAFWAQFIPRVHVGTTANFAGKTSQLYSGLTWDYDITRRVFVEGTFGGSFNDGDTARHPAPGHNAIGCHPMFRESASLGLRITDNVSVLGTIEHTSNAGFCKQNRGLTNMGGRIAYTF